MKVFVLVCNSREIRTRESRALWNQAKGIKTEAENREITSLCSQWMQSMNWKWGDAVKSQRPPLSDILPPAREGTIFEYMSPQNIFLSQTLKLSW